MSALSAKADALYALGRYNESITEYDAVFKIDPKSAKAMSGRGQALTALGRYEESARSFEESIAFSSGDLEASAEAWLDMGIAMYNWGVTSSDSLKFEEAYRCFDEVIKIMPLNSSNCLALSSEALSMKGQSLMALGREDEAAVVINSYDKMTAKGSC